ncbi:hypothetical protein SLS62_001042 [Diatrype stigma]|uniref:Peptidase A1 domain-containing protein n=1 Tax=Diatrype stigma TaxID=117547 RepID=A0AAN9YU29_9PEZI
MTFYTDLFALNKNTTLENFPLGVPLEDWAQQGYHPRMAIGLGDNSTILRVLKDGNHIASRTWSMFFGWTGATYNAQLDGTFVFGGYDRAKVDGQGYPQDLNQQDPRCQTQMLVTIDDIVLHFPNGTDASIVAGTPDGPFDACVVPDFPGLMTIANDPYMNMFMEHTNTVITKRSFGLSYYSLLYDDGAEPFQGDLTIDIRDGPSVRIPNKQLVMPERYIREEDGQIMANYSRSNLLINALQNINADDLSQLGQQFLSSAYLMVNQDSRQFTLWSADPTRVEDLVGINEEGQDVTQWCNSEPVAVPSPSESVTPPSSGDDGGGLGPGAIAGIAICGVLILASIIGVTLWKRRRGRGTVVPNPGPPSDAPVNQAGAERDFQPTYSEMGADTWTKQGPIELQGADVTEPHVQISGRQGQLPLSEQRYELIG